MIRTFFARIFVISRIGMLEDMTKNTARNITNGILLQVCDLQKVDKSEKSKEKPNDCKSDNMINKKVNKSSPKAVALFASEFLGTGLLMFLGCMGCIQQLDPPAFHHMSSLSFGLVILLIIQAFGHISGAHLNPAVTLAAVILKVISPLMSIVYISAQFFGAILGFALLKILMPADYWLPGFCMTLPHKLISPMQALAIEIIITTCLIIVVCAVWDKRNEDKQDSVAMRFAFIVAAISMVAGPLTGASMNTVRTFAPALWLNDFQHQWIYWVGPNMGAILGCGLYKYLFALPEENSAAQEEEVSLQDVKLEKA